MWRCSARWPARRPAAPAAPGGIDHGADRLGQRHGRALALTVGLAEAAHERKPGLAEDRGRRLDRVGEVHLAAVDAGQREARSAVRSANHASPSGQVPVARSSAPAATATSMSSHPHPQPAQVAARSGIRAPEHTREGRRPALRRTRTPR